MGSFNAIMVNVSRRIFGVMATLRVRMIQMKRIVNVLRTSLLVWVEGVFQHQLCVTVQATVLTEMTKTIAVSMLLCHVMLSHVIPCHVMSCHVMSCYVIVTKQLQTKPSH